MTTYQEPAEVVIEFVPRDRQVHAAAYRILDPTPDGWEGVPGFVYVEDTEGTRSFLNLSQVATIQISTRAQRETS